MSLLMRKNTTPSGVQYPWRYRTSVWRANLVLRPLVAVNYLLRRLKVIPDEWYQPDIELTHYKVNKR